MPVDFPHEGKPDDSEDLSHVTTLKCPKGLIYLFCIYCVYIRSFFSFFLLKLCASSKASFSFLCNDLKAAISSGVVKTVGLLEHLCSAVFEHINL